MENLRKIILPIYKRALYYLWNVSLLLLIQRYLKVIRNLNSQSQKLLKKGAAVFTNIEEDEITDKMLFTDKICIVCISSEKVF
jgi:hypothetical protein